MKKEEGKKKVLKLREIRKKLKVREVKKDRNGETRISDEVLDLEKGMKDIAEPVRNYHGGNKATLAGGGSSALISSAQTANETTRFYETRAGEGDRRTYVVPSRASSALKPVNRIAERQEGIHFENPELAALNAGKDDETKYQEFEKIKKEKRRYPWEEDV